jgi:hypothetical protein
MPEIGKPPTSVGGAVTDEALQIVMPSRRRVESCRRALALVPDAVVCVAAEEEPDYRHVGAPQLLIHPDKVTGMAAVRHWILTNVVARRLVIFDDDIRGVRCLVGRGARLITEPVAIRRILENSAEVAAAIGAPLFSYAITANILEFQPWDPFGFLKANGPCLGFIGRQVFPDLLLHHNTDGDLTLQALLTYRRVWQDTRFIFEHQIMTNAGGNRHMISEETWAQDWRWLKKKWGHYVVDQASGGVSRIVVRNVVRRQRLLL